MSEAPYIKAKCFLSHANLAQEELVQEGETVKLMKYAPELFNRADIEESKRVILGPGEDLSSEERWEVETKWLMQHIKFENDGLVADFGCGIGRLSREISNPVIGIDISPMMRWHSLNYVKHRPTFCPVSPDMFQAMISSGLRVSGLIAIWALAHVLEVEKTIWWLMAALRPEGILWHLDLENRSVPFRLGEELMFGRDKVEPLSLLEHFCTVEQEIPVTAWPDRPGHDAGVLRKLRRKG